MELFPLDRCGGLGGEIPEDAVDALDFGGDAADDLLEEGEVQLGGLGGDGVHGIDRTDDDGPVPGALAVGDAGRLDVGHDGEVLPDLLIQAVLGKLLTQDRVGLADGFQTVAGDGADAADAQAGAGEGLTVDHIVGQAELLAHHADLVLVQELDRLHQLKVQVLGQTADVVVGLDAVGFQNVGIDGTLGQEGDAVQLAGLFFKHADELAADDLALRLRVADAGQLVQEAVRGVHIDEVRAQLLLEDIDHLFALALAHEAVVHMDAGQLTAHRADEQRRHYGRIDAAGKRKQHLSAADLGAKRFHLLGDEGFRQRGGLDSRHRLRAYIRICHVPYPFRCRLNLTRAQYNTRKRIPKAQIRRIFR